MAYQNEIRSTMILEQTAPALQAKMNYLTATKSVVIRYTD